MLGARPVWAQEAVPVTIGVLTDMSGMYENATGHGAVEAARLAIEDSGGSVLGRPIRLLVADHQNKPDIGTAILAKWYEEDNATAAFELTTSSIALSAFHLATQKHKIAVATGPASSALSGSGCSPFGFHWVYNTYSTSKATVTALMAEHADTWFFITADYAFGHSLEQDAAELVREQGGKVLGAVRHPSPNSDFSSYLLQAQASGAEVIALANGGQDLQNAVKQANEFGLADGTRRFAALSTLINDIHSMGLQTAQGLFVTEAFYWNRNDESRVWSDRIFARLKVRPTMAQAGTYSAVLHYLKAVKASGTTENEAVVATMRSTTVDDVFAHGGRIRADGIMMHDFYLMQVKKPSESQDPWDVYNVLKTIPPQDAYRPLAKSECPLVKT